VRLASWRRHTRPTILARAGRARNETCNRTTWYLDGGTCSLSLSPRWIPVQNPNTPLQVVHRLVGCGRAWVAACPPRRPVPTVHASANRAFCSHTRYCSTAATLLSQMVYCFKFSTKILYALLNHPKRVTSSSHVRFSAPCYFASPPSHTKAHISTALCSHAPSNCSVPNCVQHKFSRYCVFQPQA
jgi:hypothetical protein